MVKDPIKNVTVLGAGTMGHSIALIFAQYGYNVQLWDLTNDKLDLATSLIKSSLDSLVSFGQIPKENTSDVFKKIKFTTSLELAATEAHFVLEAVVEVPEIKKQLFSRLNKICSDQTIFSSNTSGLNIYDLLDLNCPERLIITHWFAPPTIIPLVEVIPGERTSAEVISSTVALLKDIGKKTVLLNKFIPAFIVNRIQNAINQTVLEMIENKWATAEDIDIAVKNTLGIRLPVVGVAQSLDFAGLDLIKGIVQRSGIESRFLNQKVIDGHLGTKTSIGIYDYQNRQENEILKKRDKLYLQIRNYLDELGTFEPV